MKKLQGFDRIAPFYDFLAKMVFGNSLKKAQIHFLPHIPENARILILGGGSGWLLAELIKRNPSSEIVYVEASEKMLDLTKKYLAKKNLFKNSRITLLLDAEYYKKNDQKFDVVITNFFLDLFTEITLENIILSLSAMLKPDGLWLLSDFDKKEFESSSWKKLFISSMYFFFKKTAKIEGSKLYDFDRMLKDQPLLKLESKHFYSRMILSALYKKCNV